MPSDRISRLRHAIYKHSGYIIQIPFDSDLTFPNKNFDQDSEATLDSVCLSVVKHREELAALILANTNRKTFGFKVCYLYSANLLEFLLGCAFLQGQSLFRGIRTLLKVIPQTCETIRWQIRELTRNLHFSNDPDIRQGQLGAASFVLFGLGLVMAVVGLAFSWEYPLAKFVPLALQAAGCVLGMKAAGMNSSPNEGG